MHRLIKTAALLALAVPALVAAQSRDADQVLAEARAALGGEKLSAVKTLAATGRTLRTGPAGNTMENEFELAMELPDKYRLRSALVAMGNMSIYRHTGFSGSQLIEETDTPPNLSGGTHVVMFRFAGPNGPIDPAKMTPEQKVELDKQRLLANKREFARLTLGVFAASLPAYPLAFTYTGQAESPDGKADVIDVKGEGGFAARLFLDAATHLPLMLSWMDREPLIIRAGGPGGAVGAPGAVVRTFEGAPGGHRAEGGQPPKMSKEDLEKLEKDLDAKRAEAEANRRTVEYRVYYGDYRQVGGISFPHRIQRAIDGKTTEEMLFDSVKVNGKLDAGTFKAK